MQIQHHKTLQNVVYTRVGVHKVIKTNKINKLNDKPDNKKSGKYIDTYV